MAVFLVDYENVQSAAPLYGIERLKENDCIILFYSDSAKTINRYYWDIFCCGKCETQLTKLVKPSKNALDFYISVEVGRRIALGEKEIAIISNDKGYGAVIDYAKICGKSNSQMVLRASSIAEAKAIFTCPDDNQGELMKSLCEEVKIDEKVFNSTRKDILNSNHNLSDEPKAKSSKNILIKALRKFFG